MKKVIFSLIFLITALISKAGDPDIFYYVSDGSNELYTIDRTDGTITLIGSTGVGVIEAIAYYPEPSANVLYAANAGDFGTLNISTGAYTSIGEIDGGGTANGSAGAQSLNDVDGLMLDGQTFIMWAIERNGGATPDLLFQIDVTTGQFIADAFGTGVDYLEITGTGVDVDADDLAVDPSTGRIYASSNNSGTGDVLVEINKYTGIFTLVSTLSQDDIEGLAFSNDGSLYGTEGDGENRIGEINISTGVLSNFYSFAGNGSDVEAIASLVADANTVSGTVYEDTDLDGVKDGGETGLANVTVYLYVDVNGDGRVDPEDTRIQSTQTDVNGDYSFFYASTGSLLTTTEFSSYPASYSLTTDNIETSSFTDAVNFAETDANNDFGLATGPDCDNDGLPNFYEMAVDSDLDGILDSCDLDSDNDGIRDDVEGIEDFDDDGIPDYLDRDSDDDGIPDAIESNAGIVPAEYSSTTGNMSGADTDMNGIIDSRETFAGSGVMIATNPDSDNDGLRDYRDLDSDNDGILDIIEAGGVDTDGDGQQDVDSDFDNDGYADLLVTNPLDIPNTDETFENTNGLTNKPDYIDIDSDSDGIDDTREGLSTADYRFPTLLIDSDEDGIIDFWDISTFSTPISPYDRDGDGTPDYQDSDSDNDGVSDLIEGNDADNDGVADDAFTNTDADDNGLDDAFDASCTGASIICSSSVAHQDFDADGEDDFRDIDDDGDGIPTISEIPDSEPNGTPDYLEFNSTSCGVGFAAGPVESGNADVATNVNGVTNAGNSTGVADGAFAEIHTNGDTLLLDLSDTIPSGGSYTITWRERSGESGTAQMILEESVDGVNFTTHPSAPTTNSTTFVGAVVTANATARYLRISKNSPPSITDFEIDAVSYNTATCQLDTDNDGVANVDDIDDDNDGILDTDEDASCRGQLNYEYYDGTPSGNTVDNIPTSSPDASGTVSSFDVDDLITTLGETNDTYGLRFSGFITVSTSETYTFYTTSDDGSKLFVNGTEVVDNDGLQAATENSGTIVLTPGTYSFEVEFFENTGDEVLSVAYSTPTITKVDIPFSVLSASSGACDTDGDGVANRLDLDSDNDGISDILEAGGEASDADNNGIVDDDTDTDGDGWADVFDSDDGGTALTDSDTDGDGFQNRIDIDADDDGIVDYIEAQASGTSPTAPSGTDTDGDGIDDSFDLDSGSSLLNPVNTDGTDTDDYIDTDADNDGDLDILEGWDTDNDGIADTSPSGSDSDGDGLDDNFDDVDGLNSSTNVTNGGQNSSSFPDLDNTVSAERDWREFLDTDGDGIADGIDIDDDNDGILDTDENTNCSASVSQSLSYEFYDLEPSGNTVDNIPTTGALSTGTVTEIDVDNLQAAVDPGDADEFSIRYTGFITISTSETYTFYTSSDDGSKLFINGTEVVDNDGDHGVSEQSGNIALTPGVYSIEILFYEDGGGEFLSASYSTATITKTTLPFTVLSVTGGTCDTDGDGIPNQIDLDSDGDGIADIIEAGGVDTDNDGRVDDDTDTDNDGWADTFDSDNSGTALTDGDQDGDGFQNRIDLDADNDGIADIIEAGGTDADGDGLSDNSTDANGNGWSEAYDETEAGEVLPVVDTDGDGISNYLDLDSDSDGITDNVEGQTTAGFLAPLGSDGDDDGWDDRYDSDNGGTAIALSNKDATGDPDYIDEDSDDDGQLDYIEGFDDDEDGFALNDLLTRASNYESAAGNPLHYVNSDDTDADGVPNWAEDADGDGTLNYLDPDNGFYVDSDNDGLINLFDTDNNGAASILPDTDGDSEYDFRDTDDQTAGLPIELLNFKAKRINDIVQLDWTTQSEINNDYFEIQRLDESNHFESLGNIDGAGNSNVILNYRFFDTEPLIGENYYRLKQVDFDGTFSFSQIELVDFINFSNGKFSKVFPNPTDGEELYVQFSGIEGQIVFTLRNDLGQIILGRTLTINSTSTEFMIELLEGRKLTSGIYVLNITSEEQSSSFKIIVQ